ncbi:MAG: UvrB/UvrC motif-containing protein [candidate division Zixibacteria bacterium]|nr:UvrB/UvrC motif-containing protein [candidate division Zixibacteria bacterium]
MTQIVNNEKIVISLCKDCAGKRGFHSPLDNVPFPLAEILSGLMQQQFTQKTEPVVDIKCPHCGLTFEEFTHQGRFGCGECYKEFRPQLEPIMRKIHGSSLHKGKLPLSSVEPPLPVKEEKRIEAELKKAIETEDFERAADLRDKLKAFRESYLASKAGD